MAPAVIDYTDREQVERLVRAMPDEWSLIGFLNQDEDNLASSIDGVTDALREFANPKPRIEEPMGLGAVVEDGRGRLHFRHDVEADTPWRLATTGAVLNESWTDVDAVKVLNEGVQS